MASDKQIEANRRNAEKSTGPKSDEGKGRSRLNALKHGMRTDLRVLPGEDGEAFAARIAAWTDDLKPRNEVEQYLVDRAAGVSWQLDRIERAHVARLSANMNDAAAGVNRPGGVDVLLLGERLFWDARGPIALYPHYAYEDMRPTPPDPWSGEVHDPNNPTQLVYSLESSAAGCAWLLERWGELRSILEQGRAWQSPDKLKAIRLLGRQPIDVFDVPQVGIVFLSCHELDPGGGELLHELWNELKYGDIKLAKKRLRERPIDWLKPHSEDEALKALFYLVDRAMDRLKMLAEAHRKQADVNAGLMPSLLGFDDSAEGERLRRYEASCNRTLLRTLDALMKMRKSTQQMDPVEPADSDADHRPVTTVEFRPGFEIDSSITVEPILTPAPIAPSEISQPTQPPDLGTQSSSEPAMIHENQNRANGANAPADHENQNRANEANAPTNPHRGDGQKTKIETQAHPKDRGKKSRNGPHHRGRSAQSDKTRKTERDLTWLIPPRELLTWKPSS